ncbi:alcohol dehydrogenase [Saitoella complicata NRRL Y-17804]|nr:alcohol dehydrogenase [Saitoella complicata NRRL Y-17804]ODQ55691.1 alcohol dehydrogenase [Saitoella complicata NRRL Y-17804]
MSSGTMKAVIFKGVGKVAVEDRPIPTIQDPKDIIVKVSMTALCGSELHVYRGHQKSATDFIMGHEFTGVVHELGDDVKTVKKGDLVVTPFTVSCGECFYCKRGFTSRCEKSLLFGTPTLDGGQAEYVRIPLADASVIKAPEDVDPTVLNLMADIFPTGYFAASRVLKDLPEEERKTSVNVVIGCGPVGICAIIAAREMVETIYAIDSVPERLAEAKAHGAIPINLNDNPKDVILKATNGRGADNVLEIVGHADALQLGFDLLRPWGRISSVGVHNENIPFTGNQAYGKNLTISFGRCPVRAIFEESLQVLRRNSKALSTFVDTVMPLSKAVEGYEQFDQRKVRKVVFYPDTTSAE